MSTHEPSSRDLPVRDDYRTALLGTIDAIADAGAWLDGATRVAIARIARFAFSDPDPLAPWVQLSTDPERLRHATDHPVSAVIADATYRVARHASTVTAEWYEHTVNRDPDFGDDHYVELVSIVVRVTAADRFCRAAGVALVDLPTPRPGEPSRVRPSGARVDRHWVPTVAPKDASPDLAWMYPGKAAPNVLRALSLVPGAYRELMAFQRAGYVPSEALMDLEAPLAERALSRPQIELLAARTSAANDCFY